jgi:Cys-tRNA(Pro) deacylase
MTVEVFDPGGLETFLKEKGVWYRFVEKAETIHTADAAREAGIDLSRVTKSLVLLDQDRSPILAIIPGDCKLSFAKLKAASGSKKVRLVPFDEAGQFSGYPPGGTPMVRHKVKMKVILDRRLTAYDSLYGGGGDRTTLLELKVPDILHLDGAKVADIVEE